MNILNRKEAINQKSKYYYTGCPCKNGHLSKRLTSNGTCYQCILNRNKIYTRNNQDKIKNLKKKWYERTKTSEYKKQYRGFDLVESYISKTKLRQLTRRYNISEKEYLELLQSNDSLCHICNKKETAKTKDGKEIMLSVDHCHDTGKIRGLLCYTCNTALGLFKDSEELLSNAILYLKR